LETVDGQIPIEGWQYISLTRTENHYAENLTKMVRLMFIKAGGTIGLTKLPVKFARQNIFVNKEIYEPKKNDDVDNLQSYKE